MGTDRALPPLNDAQGRNNLEAIKGIGPAFSQALNRIGICRFIDLARYTPQDLSNAFHDQAGLKVPAERIESQKWIEQAKAMAQQLDIESAPAQEEPQVAKEPHNPTDRHDWRQRAGFSLFFDYVTAEHSEQTLQTRVYHEESGEETLVRGKDTTAWVNWILERAQLLVTAESASDETTTVGEYAVPLEAIPAPPVPMPPDEARLEILDTQLSEIGLVPDALHKKLMATICFRLSGPQAEVLAADSIPFRIELHVVDLKSGASNLVTSTRNQLQPQVLEYAIRQEFPMLDVGHYEVHSIILMLPPHEMMTHYRTPSFKVVP